MNPVRRSVPYWSPLLLLWSSACGGDQPSGPPPAPPPAAAVARLVLPQKPAGAVAVLAARAGGPAQQVAVSGRVAAVTAGRAAFTLMDLTLPYCGETNPEDHCKTPWDYCCETKETRLASALPVEVRGDDGKAVASSLPDIRLLDAVTVTGRLTKDELGNFLLLADGLFRDARPALPSGLQWPR